MWVTGVISSDEQHLQVSDMQFLRSKITQYYYLLNQSANKTISEIHIMYLNWEVDLTQTLKSCSLRDLTSLLSSLSSDSFWTHHKPPFTSVSWNKLNGTKIDAIVEANKELASRFLPSPKTPVTSIPSYPLIALRLHICA